MFEEKWDTKTTGWWRPMCYAESDDGIHWTKPELGLVEFNGNKKNNICLIQPAGSALARVDDFLTVVYEPDDPDPSRRFKAAYIAHIPQAEFKGIRPFAPTHRIICAMVCATSADGLTWRVVGDRPSVNENLEVSGLYKFGNFYYATGQQMTPWAWMPDGSDSGRMMAVYRSADFEHWSDAKALGFARPGQWPAQPASGEQPVRVNWPPASSMTAQRAPGQQTHMGAGLWNRGNVLVGLYGMWQDGPAERPKGELHLYGTRIALGLITSNDGVHFREPVPDFKVIARGGEKEWDSIGLLQGHAFENVGERTYIWYAHWDCEFKGRPQEVGLAFLRRDGFGYLARRHKELPGSFVTCPIRTEGKKAELIVNVEGASSEHPLKVELLDEFARPIPGYSGADAAKITGAGTRQEVVWPKSGRAEFSLKSRFALKVDFPSGGDARVYAVYAEAIEEFCR
jgi:hypothetical protein